MSVFASGIAKLILGSTAVSLGAAGALVKLSFGEIKEESLKTTSIKSNEKQVPNIETEKSDAQQSTEVSESAKSPTETSVVEPIPVPKPECRLHKLKSEFEGSFEPTTKEKLQSELLSKSQNFQEIMKACELESNKNKDVFVSNKGGKGWLYYPDDQTKLKGKFDKYLGTEASRKK
ncbi:hypothetical protein MHC_03390 [Mycoplasma haemocanis str. Illinois]|uniref:Uncharacterized protein n=1 Tax=Mycoplasma haemocanis (strain Illinois) TaxID=1111676 RepID=H6N7B6_MYCHN|nr:hypothetical protein [Mycoplasma haemocanis]AEW45538.1 hypothetical protein MHC_03390 [Mycoplasma haemocanis str. Illinois]